MTKEFKFIAVRPDGDQVGGKPTYEIVNRKSGDSLGRIEYFPAWRKWIFAPDDGCIFDSECLANINHCIADLKENA